MAGKIDTQWENVSYLIVAKHLRGSHYLWERLFDGALIYTVRPINEIPADNDGGYFSISSALAAKGIVGRIHYAPGIN